MVGRANIINEHKFLSRAVLIAIRYRNLQNERCWVRALKNVPFKI